MPVADRQIEVRAERIGIGPPDVQQRTVRSERTEGAAAVGREQADRAQPLARTRVLSLERRAERERAARPFLSQTARPVGRRLVIVECADEAAVKRRVGIARLHRIGQHHAALRLGQRRALFPLDIEVEPVAAVDS